MSAESTDVVIVGGGIVGSAIARELSRYQLAVILLESETDVAMGTSKANSAILHAGFDATPGTWKGKLNVRGNHLYHQLWQDLSLDVDWMGSLVVAKDDAEQATIEELLGRGKQNGVPNLEILSADKLLEREPNLAPDVTGALWAPSAGVVCPFGAVFGFIENAIRNGVTLLRECPVQGIVIDNGRVVGVVTPHGVIRARFIINAAGIQADAVARMAGDNSFTIHPRKGEYILFDKTVRQLVNTVIFPTPSKVSKGILVSPTVHGNLFIGPDAEDVADKDDVSTTAAGMERVINGARRIVPQLPLAAAITEFSGLRAASGDGDFILRESETAKGLIHVAGIQSPGFTAAPAIAEVIADILREAGLALIEKAEFNPVNPPRRVFREMSWQERAEIVARDPFFGRVICRCETVTEAEIVAAIHSPCGAITVDGVKRRTRAGTGRCQGGFCGPRVTAILSRELGIPITAVRKDGIHSFLFSDKLPGACEVSTDE
ncbi:MAG: dependent oxidoreductase [Anaerosporomusa subterranea]|jgi:glycerol-3-phosphate dehydrogenase|nr:dependent oxidoreductase [Anaerosporomusa subterranea]